MYIPACPSLLCPTFVATLAPSKPNTKKPPERTDEGESEISSSSEAALGLKDGQSLTVDLPRGQVAHQTLELKFRNASAGRPSTVTSLFPHRING